MSLFSSIQGGENDSRSSSQMLISPSQSQAIIGLGVLNFSTEIGV